MVSISLCSSWERKKYRNLHYHNVRRLTLSLTLSGYNIVGNGVMLKQLRAQRDDRRAGRTNSTITRDSSWAYLPYIICGGASEGHSKTIRTRKSEQTNPTRCTAFVHVSLCATSSPSTAEGSRDLPVPRACMNLRPRSLVVLDPSPRLYIKAPGACCYRLGWLIVYAP